MATGGRGHGGARARSRALEGGAPTRPSEPRDAPGLGMSRIVLSAPAQSQMVMPQYDNNFKTVKYLELSIPSTPAEALKRNTAASSRAHDEWQSRQRRTHPHFTWQPTSAASGVGDAISFVMPAIGAAVHCACVWTSCAPARARAAQPYLPCPSLRRFGTFCVARWAAALSLPSSRMHCPFLPRSQQAFLRFVPWEAIVDPLPVGGIVQRRRAGGARHLASRSGLCVRPAHLRGPLGNASLRQAYESRGGEAGGSKRERSRRAPAVLRPRQHPVHFRAAVLRGMDRRWLRANQSCVPAGLQRGRMLPRVHLSSVPVDLPRPRRQHPLLRHRPRVRGAERGESMSVPVLRSLLLCGMS